MMHDLENKVHNLLKIIRTNPKYLVPMLEYRLQYFDDNLLKLPGKISLRTREGPAVVEEAIAYLNNLSPQPEMIREAGLDKCAKEHSDDIGSKGLFSHSGSDGSKFYERINKYGKWGITAAENMYYGSEDSKAEDILIELIIDDGNASRGHRLNTFKAAHKHVGLGIAFHIKYGLVCTIDFAGSYIAS